MSVSLKLCVGFSIFNSVLFLSKFILLFSKKHRLFHFKRHNSFKIKMIEKPQTLIAPRPLIFELQQEV